MAKTKAKDRKDFRTAEEYSASGDSKASIVRAIRRESMVYRAKFVAIARHIKEVELPDGQKRRLVECQGCFELFHRDDVEGHHLTDVGQLGSTSVEDIRAFQDRIFCRASGIVPLCKAKCHLAAHHQDDN